MTEDELLWEPVNAGGEYKSYPLAFVNIDQDDETVSLNVDGDESDLENPEFQGEYRGLTDISSQDNPKPSMKHLIESEKDERTYAFNNVKSLESQFEEVEVGDVVKVVFEGYEHPEDGLPWQNFTVYTPSR